MSKSSKMIVMIEPQLEEAFRGLASKRELSASALLRSLMIDELRAQGLLPQETAMAMFKGVA